MPQVGDIFVCSWGYDQTNIDFYQVTRVLNSMIEVTEIEGKRKYDGHMCGSTVPVPNSFVGRTRRVKLSFNGNGKPSFKPASYSWAHLTDPKESHFFSEWH
jgi:hypothetical protein